MGFSVCPFQNVSASYPCPNSLEGYNWSAVNYTVFIFWSLRFAYNNFCPAKQTLYNVAQVLGILAVALLFCTFVGWPALVILSYFFSCRYYQITMSVLLMYLEKALILPRSFQIDASDTYQNSLPASLEKPKKYGSQIFDVPHLHQESREDNSDINHPSADFENNFENTQTSLSEDVTEENTDELQSPKPKKKRRRKKRVYNYERIKAKTKRIFTELKGEPLPEPLPELEGVVLRTRSGLPYRTLPPE